MNQLLRTIIMKINDFLVLSEPRLTSTYEKVSQPYKAIPILIMLHVNW
jgi:hypothetical protein